VNGNDTLRTQLSRIQTGAFVAGLVVLALCGFGATGNAVQFFRSYLFAFLFWVGLSLGCLAVLMVHYVAGGRWGYAVRRMLEAGTKTLPLMGLLFIPLLFGLPVLYIWARPEAVAADPLLRHKEPYLNVPFFIGRAVFYFAVWIGLASALDRAATAQDESPSRALTGRLLKIGGGGLLAYGLTMTFASIDWAMSLDPHWYSTIYGVLFLAGQALGAFALVIVVAVWLRRQPTLAEALQPQQLHDLGNFMLTFVIFWAYISFSQFLIIWAGNLPEETTWYLRRFHGGWGKVGLFLVALHFFVPFLLLLSRDVKRNPRAMGAVAVGLLVLCVVDLFWIVVPGYRGVKFGVHWMDVAALVGIGGLWLGAFLRRLKSRSLVPAHDARVEEALEVA
jgi:hypothetical protein